jgi:hypothetical protein
MSPEEHDLLQKSLASYLDQNLISEILEVVRGGKEATVLRCRAGSSHNGNGAAPAAFYAA